MTDTIKNYEHLWADANGPWALLQLNPGTEEVPRYMVVNRSDRSVLVIEDDGVAEAVKQRMLAAAVPVVWVGNGF
jgi:hypothetical protein